MSDVDELEVNVTLPSQRMSSKPRDWDRDQELGYSCEIRAQKGEDTGFVAYVPTLAGVYGQGDSVPAAIDDAARALTAALKTYVEENKPIPWREPECKREGEESYRVVVNA